MATTTADLTIAGANALLELFRGGTYYLARFTVAPTDTTPGTEVTGGTYARVQLTTANMAAASAGAMASSAAIAFPTATTDEGTTVAVGIMSALTGGACQWYKAVTSQSVPTGVTYQMASGSLTVSFVHTA